MQKYGLEDKVTEINRSGVLIAREAVGNDIIIAGSIGPLGTKIEPWGPTSIEEAKEAFCEQAQALLEGGVDLFVLETFSDINEIHQAIRAVQGLGQPSIIVAQMTIDEEGNSLYGTTPEVFTNKLEEWDVQVIGLNCSVGPAHMHQCIERISQRPESFQG